MKIRASTMILTLLMFTCEPALGQSYAPKGLVPDAHTAIAIARAVLIPIYGAKQIQSEEPLKATRKNDHWLITGTLQCAPNCVGGVATVSLSARDGRVLSVFHPK